MMVGTIGTHISFSYLIPTYVTFIKIFVDIIRNFVERFVVVLEVRTLCF